MHKTAFDLDLSSYHPRLRTFRFIGKTLPPSFLNRHPTIEYLSVTVTHSPILGDCDLPQLKALCVNANTLFGTPGLLSRRPITHLRLYDVFDATSPAMHQLIKNTRATLRHLELIWTQVVQLIPFIEECSTYLLQVEELRVSPSQTDVPFCQHDIVSFFGQSFRHVIIDPFSKGEAVVVLAWSYQHGTFAIDRPSQLPFVGRFPQQCWCCSCESQIFDMGNP
jgi:hypothetical protein